MLYRNYHSFHLSSTLVEVITEKLPLEDEETNKLTLPKHEGYSSNSPVDSYHSRKNKEQSYRDTLNAPEKCTIEKRVHYTSRNHKNFVLLKVPHLSTEEFNIRSITKALKGRVEVKKLSMVSNSLACQVQFYSRKDAEKLMKIVRREGLLIENHLAMAKFSETNILV